MVVLQVPMQLDAIHVRVPARRLAELVDGGPGAFALERTVVFLTCTISDWRLNGIILFFR